MDLRKLIETNTVKDSLCNGIPCCANTRERISVSIVLDQLCTTKKGASSEMYSDQNWLLI